MYDGRSMHGKNSDADLWIFLKSTTENTYSIIDFVNRKFVYQNYTTRTVYTLPFTSCSPTTQYSVQKLNNSIYWIISTIKANITYVLISATAFNPITTTIDAYAPNSNEKYVITLAGSNIKSFYFSSFFKNESILSVVQPIQFSVL